MSPMLSFLAHFYHTIPHLYLQFLLSQFPFSSSSLFFSLYTPSYLY